MLNSLVPGTLRSRIIIFSLLILLPVICFVTFTVEIVLVPSIKQSIRNELANSTRVITNAIRQGATASIRNHLRAIAERNLEIAHYYLSLVDQNLLSREEAINRLEEIFLSQKVGTSGYLYCLDSSGKVVVHPSDGVRGNNLSSFDFVRRQMDVREGYLEYDWKNPDDPGPRAKALYMVYFEPLDWIISASSYRSEFNQLLHPEDFRETVMSLRFDESGYAYVIDESGQALIHPKYQNYNILAQQDGPADFAREMLSRGTGSLEYIWQNPGEKKPRKKIAVFEKIEEFGWLVVSSAYLDEVMRPVWVARLVSHLSMILLLIGSWAMSYYLSGRITRQVDEMMKQLDRNAREGQLNPLPVFTEDELGRLAEEFNSFMTVIRNQNRNILEQRVRYRSLFEATPDAVLLFKGVRIIDCNPAAISIFQAEGDTVIGRTALDLSPEKQKNGEDSKVLAGKLVGSFSDFSMKAFDWLHCTLKGEVFDAEVRLKVFGEEEGKPLILSYIRDITERKRAEEALRESELKYRQLIDNALDAIFIIQNGRFVFTNHQTSLISEYSEEELKKVSLEELIHPEDLPMIMERFRKRISGEHVISTYTFRFISKTGKELNAQISAVLINWNGKPATLNFVRDVTQLKQMEAAFHEAQKLEAIGRLAGGIAHDFNNILMGIQGRTSLIERASPSPEVRENLNAISRQVTSAAALTRQLLGFAKGGQYDPRPLSLNRLLSSSADMFGRTRKEIEIITNLPEGQVVVEADKAQMEQVLLNLYMNSWQAMPDGGELRIGLGVEILDDMTCGPYGLDAGEYAAISVADNGIGMEKSVQEKIFDPFFTTKDKERGTGLGLASAYGIIQNHHGIIILESEVGVGSTFIIFLPLSNKTVEEDEKIDREICETGDETILLVDDEDMILEVGAAMLKELGYRVIAARGGQQAIDIVMSGRERIDLVILDLVMPGVDGEKTLEQIRKVKRDLPVILSSGYSADGQAAKILRNGHCRDFIQKPFNLSELSGKVRTIFDNIMESKA